MEKLKIQTKKKNQFVNASVKLPMKYTAINNTWVACCHFWNGCQADEDKQTEQDFGNISSINCFPCPMKMVPLENDDDDERINAV